MATIDLKSLVSRLNEPCRRALEAAAGLTLSRDPLQCRDRALADQAARYFRWRPAASDPSLRDRRGPAAHRPEPRDGSHEDRQRAGAEPVAGSCRMRQAGLAVRLARARRGAACDRGTCCGRCWPTRRWRGARARPPASCCGISADLLKRDFAAITAGSGEAAGGNAGRRSGARAGSADGRAPLPASPALEQFTIDLTALRARREDRSGARPRRRDPPGHRHPDAAAAEQPDPDRRGRRRQDRGRRGLRAARRRRRRAAGAARMSRCARSIWACCRPAPASRASSRTG